MRNYCLADLTILTNNFIISSDLALYVVNVSLLINSVACNKSNQ